MASYAAVDALKAMLDRDRTLEAHFIFREKLYRKAAEIIEHYVFAERLRTRAAAAAHTPEAASDSPADGVEAGVRAVLQKLKIPSGSSHGRKPLADDSFSVSLNYEPKPGNEPGVIWRLGLHRHVQSSIGPHTTDRYQILDKSDVAHHGRSPWLRDQSHTLAAAPIDRHAPSIAAVLRKAAKKRAEDKAVAFDTTYAAWRDGVRAALQAKYPDVARDTLTEQMRRSASIEHWIKIVEAAKTITPRVLDDAIRRHGADIGPRWFLSTFRGVDEAKVPPGYVQPFARREAGPVKLRAGGWGVEVIRELTESVEEGRAAGEDENEETVAAEWLNAAISGNGAPLDADRMATARGVLTTWANEYDRIADADKKKDTESVRLNRLLCDAATGLSGQIVAAMKKAGIR
jgi:hypothetical protein